MVGLSIVLEPHRVTNNKKYNTQVITKATVTIKPSPSPPPSMPLPATGFLDRCFLCCQRLLPGKDIYMYKGDRAFCSVECRCRQIFMDEEETNISLHKNDSCSFSAVKSPKHPSSSSPSPSSSSAAASRNRKGTRNRANGFAH
ncbi:hypothetical protein RHMOL_Rhmol04G0360000 [Rhododendron molle]|uniref:Uncharacterized protein n=1 Tax=Rhododendron molle TaxID=49168 RepID=A0ACC0P8E5_RHOML|nr:hypothetical protein RHMOL_Rhmol04G0360000 [Rhododendron molle]